jgi:molecular chaperone DnaK
VEISLPKTHHEGKDLKINLTRHKYEELCQDLVARCIPSIGIAMKDGDVTVQNIDEIVLVGDFTRTPMIFKMID